MKNWGYHQAKRRKANLLRAHKSDSIPWTAQDIAIMARRDSTLPHLKLQAILAEKKRDEEYYRVQETRHK